MRAIKPTKIEDRRHVLASVLSWTALPGHERLFCVSTLIPVNCRRRNAMSPNTDPSHSLHHSMNDRQYCSKNRGQLTAFDFVLTGFVIFILGIGYLVGFLRSWLGW
jgi:hypothetical protein